MTENEIGPGLFESVYEAELGYLLNFREELLKNGIVRCVNGLPE